MHLTVIEELRTSSVAMRVSSRAAELAVAGEPAVQVVELAAQAAQEALAVRAGPVVPEDPAVRAALAVPEDPVVPVALVVLENQVASVVPEDPAVLENPVALAVPENPVVPGPETALGVGPERALVQLAVALKTKSVTTRPRRGLVAAPRVEDSAAVAETTREPVAAEAVRAWAAVE
jgi:hypothetical protein